MKKGVYFSLFLAGIAILVVLAASYFIPITLTAYSANGVIALVKDSLLGIIIFHNLYVLIIYILIAIALIFISLRKIKIKVKK